MRHSIPEKSGTGDYEIGLSDEGIKLALRKKEIFNIVDACFTSPYRRALWTALLLFEKPQIIQNLHERLIGENEETDFWIKQYTDYDYKNKGGESLNEVKIRMLAAINLALERISEGETAIIVSHATAICAYLLNCCKINVVDAASKSREIIFKNESILKGEFNPADYFVLNFENGKITEISFLGLEQ